jgi:uncharacterized protein (DUF362 family)
MDDSGKHNLHPPKNKFLNRVAFYSLGILSLAWLLLRSGTKPSRLAYPCQRTAAAFGLNFLSGLSPWLGASLLAKARPVHGILGEARISRHSTIGSLLRCILVLSPILFLSPGGPTEAGFTTASPARNAVAPERIVRLPGRPDPNPTVAIAHTDHTPDEAEIAAMVEQAIDGALGPEGLGQLVKSGDVVLVKPNLGCGYKSYETTDWRVVKPIVQKAKQAGASQVYIGEGEGCGYGMGVFDGAGYTANITDVTYVNFNDIGSAPDYNYYDVSVSGGLWDTPIAIPQVYFDADVVISVPKLKTHSAAGVTLSLKNAMGVPPVPLYSSPGWTYRNLIHDNYEVRKTIAQINLARKPDFAVIDAILAGQGEGPWAANPIEMDTILASRDLVALDAVGATIMGIDPQRIPYLVYAHEKNLGTLDLDSIQITGTPIAAVQKNFSLPVEAATIYRKAAVLQRTAMPMMVDGSLADWSLIEPVVLDKPADIITDTNKWNGPQDLSLESRFVYDPDALYVIFHVRDEQKVEEPNPGQIGPPGDRLELDVSVADPWYRLDKPAYGDDDFRFSIGYNPNPVVWDIGRGEVLQNAQVSLVDSGDGYLVELRIPFEALNQFVPAENKQIGLDFSVVDVDSGMGETKMAWSGGTGLPEDARLMGVGLLGPQRGCTNPTTGCVFLPIQLKR